MPYHVILLMIATRGRKTRIIRVLLLLIPDNALLFNQRMQVFNAFP